MSIVLSPCGGVVRPPGVLCGRSPLIASLRQPLVLPPAGRRTVASLVDRTVLHYFISNGAILSLLATYSVAHLDPMEDDSRRR